MQTRFTTAALFLGTVIVLVLCGCQTVKQSKGWKTVANARIPGRGDPAQSEAYAQQLHQLLTENGIESKIVTFTLSGSSDPSLGQSSPVQVRSAVVYRNDESPKYPWWLM